MQREFGDLQNLPQDLRSFRRFCGPQTVFAWDLDSAYVSRVHRVVKNSNVPNQIVTVTNENALDRVYVSP